MNNENIVTQNKNNSVIKYILIGLIIILSIVAIFLTFKTFTKNKNKTRTVMIYMVGADLESKSGLATIDLESIDYSKMDNENVNVVLMAGGSKSWNNSYINKNETSIFELKESGFEKVKTQNVLNMGDDKVFSSYLNYVYDNYKTDEYDLVFWNHGAAIYGSEMDELSKDVLSLEDMNKGLSNSPFNKKKLEIIIFRTCLNGTLEVATKLDDYSKYLVASEEVTLGSSFTSVLNFINKIEPMDNAFEIGTKYIDSYKENINGLKTKYSNKSNIYSTYSIVNLSKINNLVNSLNEFIKEVDINNNYDEIARIRSNMYQYAYTQSNKADYDMVDLYNLVNNLKSHNEMKAQKVLNDLENAVEYNWATNDNSRGLSIYFPFNGKNTSKKMFLDIYKNLDNLKDYYNFINRFYNIQTGNVKSYSFDSNAVTFNNNTSNNNESDFTLELTDEQIKGFAKAKYIVFKDNKDGYYLPVYIGGKATLNGNKLTATIKDKQLKVVDKKDKKSCMLTLVEAENTDEYIKYNTNVILQNFSNFDKFKMNNAQMNLILNKNDKNVSLNNVVLISEESLEPNTVSIDLKEYTKIGFGSSKYKIFDNKGNFTTNWQSNGVYEGCEAEIDNIDFDLQSFEDTNDYYSIFMIWDTNNNIHYSKLIKMN